jgi:hypothetical protein
MLRSKMLEDIIEYSSQAPKKVFRTELRSYYHDFASWVSFEHHYSLRISIESLQNAIENESDNSNDQLENLESKVQEMEEQISEGVCFDCVGNYGSHNKRHDTTKPNLFF